MEIGFWEEKWNYKVDFDCGVSEEIKKDFSSQPVVYKKFQVEPLIWNDFEKIVIDKFFEIIKNLSILIYLIYLNIKKYYKVLKIDYKKISKKRR